MFRNVDSEMAGKTLDTDICIVGAGAAGITVAQQLIDSGLNVLLLESGGTSLEPETQQLYQGINTGREYFDLANSRLRFFGGSTNHWGGMCAPLDAGDFDYRCWISRSGWPISLSDLKNYYEQAIKVCDLQDSLIDIDELAGATGYNPLEFKVPPKFLSRVIQYSPPTRFGMKFGTLLENSRNIQVIFHANVLKFMSNENGDLVKRVEVSDLARNMFWVRAKNFVLATGGIENARLLLLSNDVHKHGIGNDSDFVGRCFMEHPQRWLGRIVPRDSQIDLRMYHGASLRRVPGIRSSAFLQPANALLEKAKILKSIISMTPIYEDNKIADFFGRVARRLFDRDHLRSIREIEVEGEFEQVPNRASFVALSENLDFFGQPQVQLNWLLGPLDEVTVRKTASLLGQAIGGSGLGRLQIDIHERNKNGWPASHHHMGTTRMSHDRNDGVVDKNCRIHGIVNLYVAGSSVFTTAGAVNPTFTIVALALRLANHLRRKV